MEKTYPLSHAQKRIYYSNKLLPGSTLGMMTCHFEIEASKIETVIKSLNILLRTFDVFSFEIVGEITPTIIVHSKPINPIYSPVIFSNKNEQNAYIQELIINFTNDSVHLYRLIPARFHNGQFGFIIQMNHIIYDGWSNRLFGEFVQNISHCLETGNDISDILDSHRHRYIEHILDEQNYLKSNRFVANRSFWLEYLSDLPDEFVLPKSHTFKVGRIDSIFSEKALRSIQVLCTFLKTAPYDLLLTVTSLSIAHWQNQNRFVLGTVTHGRTSKTAKNMGGMFVNTLPQIINVDFTSTISELLKQLRNQTVSLYKNQKYPYDILISDLQAVRGTNDDLIQFIYSYEESETNVLNVWYPIEYDLYPLVIHINQRTGPGIFGFEIDYHQDVFSEAEISVIPNVFEKILDQLENHLNEHLHCIDVSDRSKNIEGFALTDTDIVSEFEKCVIQNGAHPAITFQKYNYQYQQLHHDSTNLAKAILDLHSIQNKIVALHFTKSYEMIVSILAVLKAGAAYLPVDPDLPLDRKQDMLNDSGCSLVLHNTDELLNAPVPEISYDEIIKISFDRTAVQLPEIKPDSLAYILYTSGSTGKPKAVRITHRNVVRLHFADDFPFDFGPDDVWTMAHTFSFDFTVWEIWGALLRGGRLVLVPKSVTHNLEEFIKLVSDEEVTIFSQTPSAFYAFEEIAKNIGNVHFPKLRYVFLGGESLNPKMLQEFNKINPGAILVNGYGPTEATVFSTFKFIDKEALQSDLSNIGVARHGADVLFINKFGKVVPAGWKGELCIAGEGVGLGYLHRPELTKEKFVQHPYNENEKIYRSGDLGRRLPNGDIEFLGRIDDQVQVRGFRVEMGEIEARLVEIENISHAVVLAVKEESGTVSLRGVIETTSKISVVDIREKLAISLPEYMVPTSFVFLDSMPLTINGKVDRKKLLQMEPQTMGDENEADRLPEAENEKVLALVWEEVLKVKSIKVGQNFYHLGGDSIKAIQIAAKLRTRGFDLAVASIFKFPTIIELANCIQSLQIQERKEATGEVPLTPIQSWFFSMNLQNPHEWNQQATVELKSEYAAETIHSALVALVKRHEALRTVYERNPEGAFSGRILSTDEKPERFVALEGQIDIEKGPLVKANIIKGEKNNRLVLAIHHLAVDGVSWQIILTDLFGILKDKSCSADDSVSYKEWSLHVQDFVQAGNANWELPFWKNIAAAKVDKVESDIVVTGRFEKDRESLASVFSSETTSQLLGEANISLGTEAEQLLLASYFEAIARWQGVRRLRIFKESHGRRQTGNLNIVGTVGWFTSLFPILLEQGEDLVETIINVKETLKQVPHLGTGYGLLRYLKSEDISLNCPLDLSFNFLGEMPTEISDFCRTGADKNSIPFGLEANCWIDRGQLKFQIDYSRKEFQKESVKTLMRHLEAVLREIVNSFTSKKQIRKSPADFGFPGLSYADFLIIQEKPWFSVLERLDTLTPMEQAMFLSSLKGDQAYQEDFKIVLNRPIKEEKAKEALKTLIQAHESLRSVYIVNGLQAPVKAVLREQALDGPLDLENGPLFQLSINGTTLHIVFHHIILDGWSLFILLRQLLEYCSDEENISVLPTSTAEYTRWLRERNQEAGLSYWLEYLKGYEGLAGIPVSNSTKENSRDYARGNYAFTLSKETVENIVELTTQNSITQNVFFQAAWALLLMKYNNTEDVAFGAVTTVRPAELNGIDEVPGLFINTVPVRIGLLSSEVNFNDVLTALSKQTLTDHDYLSLSAIQGAMGQELVNHVMAFESYPAMQDGIYKVLSFEGTEQTVYDFNIVILPGSEIEIRFFYNEKVYSVESMTLLASRFQWILEQCSGNSEIPVKNVHLVSSDERAKIERLIRGETSAIDSSDTILKWFEHARDLDPFKIAVIDGDNRITYRELDRKANAFAAQLSDKGFSKEDIGLIVADRSIETVIRILAVMKLGIPYLPIDSEYPRDRIEFIIRDSAAKEVPPLPNMIIEAPKPPTAGPSANDVAYIIYTSGSTGKPKGVRVKHQGFVNLLQFHTKIFGSGKSDRMTLAASPGFDAMALELWPALCCGAELHIVPSSIRVYPAELCDWMKAKRITLSFQSTPIAESLLEQDWSENSTSLRVMLTGGDTLRKSPVDTIPFTLFNLYGPTEATVFCTAGVVAPETNMSKTLSHSLPDIGSAVDNFTCAIFDEHQRYVPIGLPGELYIGGIGLAEGYHNRPDLTEERFVVINGVRYYKTGDIAKMKVDGRIEFLGRQDNQVKIRGNRVETGEIEKIMEGLPQVASAVVVPKLDSSGSKFLAAFCTVITEKVKTSQSQRDHIVAVVRTRLIEKLPSYMMPAVITILEELPLTPHGKVDRGALEKINIKKANTEFVAPRNEAEEFVTKTWEQVLEREGIGVHDNFFEVGGDSLSAIKVHVEISKKFVLSLNSLFEYETVEELAKQLTTRKNDVTSSIERIQNKARLFKDPMQVFWSSEQRLKEYRALCEPLNTIELGNPTEYQHIFLTGATGYLGSYLLRELLTRFPKVKLSVLIRSDENGKARERFEKSVEYYFGPEWYSVYANLINVVEGTLEDESFFESLPESFCNSVDCIINSAALVKHYGKYEEFYQANVVGVYNLVQFASRGRKKDIHHISTTSVGLPGLKNEDVVLFTEFDYYNEEIDNPYVNTKIAAESVLHDARSRGINTAIYRVGNLMFDSQSGRFQKNIHDNAFYTALKSYVAIGVIPALRFKIFDLSFIDCTAAAVATLVDRKISLNNTWHVMNPHFLSLHDLGSYLKDFKKINGIVKFERFLARMYEQGEDPRIKPFINNIMLHSHILDNPHLTGFVQKSDKTGIILKRLGFVWPKVDTQHIRLMLQHCDERDFFELPDSFNPEKIGKNRSDIQRLVSPGLARQRRRSDGSHEQIESPSNSQH